MVRTWTPVQEVYLLDVQYTQVSIAKRFNGPLSCHNGR